MANKLLSILNSIFYLLSSFFFPIDFLTDEFHVRWAIKVYDISKMTSKE